MATSKFKDHPGYARARRGHIGIQDHGDFAAFRSIQIRELGWEPLFNGKDLAGWKNYGEEKWTVENGEILGEAVTKAYGYLGTEKTYKDFEMRGKFKAEGTGNSGIFYHASITGTSINGVQVEVDPRPNMHTGGLYETGGRQWIVWPNSAAEQAMKVGDWNEVRFSVRGNHIMTWVNGVLALDYTDPAPKFTDGIIALQLHSGGEGRMRFKDLYVARTEVDRQACATPAARPTAIGAGAAFAAAGSRAAAARRRRDAAIRESDVGHARLRALTAARASARRRRGGCRGSPARSALR